MKLVFSSTKRSKPDLRPSFSLPYNGGEIWISCIDNLEDNTALIKEKVLNFEKIIGRPSSSSLVLYHLDGTKITYEIANFIIDSLKRSRSWIRKLAFVGLTKKGKENIKKYLSKFGVEYNIPSKYFPSMDLAKEWLINERY